MQQLSPSEIAALIPCRQLTDPLPHPDDYWRNLLLRAFQKSGGKQWLLADELGINVGQINRLLHLTANPQLKTLRLFHDYVYKL